MTPELPTDPGLYLFVGTRRPQQIGFSDLLRSPLVEKIRVSRSFQGKLTYIGSDFMYKPGEALGVWLKLDVTDLVAQGETLLQARFVTDAVPKMKDKSWYRPHGRTQFADYLTSDVGGVFSKKKLRPEQSELVSTLADLAVTLKLVKP